MKDCELHIKWREVNSNTSISDHHRICFSKYDPNSDQYTVTLDSKTFTDLIKIAAAHGVELEFINSNYPTKEEQELGFEICKNCDGTGAANSVTPQWSACETCSGLGIVSKEEIPLLDISEKEMQNITNQLSIEARYPRDSNKYVSVHINGILHSVPSKIKYEDLITLTGIEPDKILSISKYSNTISSMSYMLFKPNEEIKLNDGDILQVDYRFPNLGISDTGKTNNVLYT